MHKFWTYCAVLAGFWGTANGAQAAEISNAAAAERAIFRSSAATPAQLVRARHAWDLARKARLEARLAFLGSISSHDSQGNVQGFALIGDIKKSALYSVRIGDVLPTIPSYRLVELKRQSAVFEGEGGALEVWRVNHVNHTHKRKKRRNKHRGK